MDAFKGGALLLVTRKGVDNRKGSGLVFGYANGNYLIEDVSEGLENMFNIRHNMFYICSNVFSNPSLTKSLI